MGDRQPFHFLAQYLDNIMPDQAADSRPYHWAKTMVEGIQTDDGNLLDFGFEVLTQMPYWDQLQSIACLVLAALDF